MSTSDAADPYGERVRALFAGPTHAGMLAGAVVVSNADQGIRVELSAQAASGRVERAAFRAWGCPHSIAACEASCAAIEGATVAAVEEFEAGKIMQSLAVPAEKSARILVIEDTVRLLGAALRKTASSGRQD